MHKLELRVKKGEISLCLKDGQKAVDASSWDDEINLSEKLLSEIDKILKKNRIKKEAIRKMEVKSDIPSGYTTVRIAETVVKVFNWANAK